MPADQRAAAMVSCPRMLPCRIQHICCKTPNSERPLREADDAVRLIEPGVQMEGAARLVAKFAVARELGAAAPGRPCLAGGEQGACVPATAEGFLHVDALEVADGARVRALHVVVAQLAVGEPGGFPVGEQQEDGRLVAVEQRGELGLQFGARLFGPEPHGEHRDGFQVELRCFAYHKASLSVCCRWGRRTR